MTLQVFSRLVGCSVIIAGFFGIYQPYASAMDCNDFVQLPGVDQAVQALGLKQTLLHGHISSEDFLAMTLANLANASFVDKKRRLVTLQYLTGFKGEIVPPLPGSLLPSPAQTPSPQYDTLLVYKYDIGDDWDKKDVMQFFPQGVTLTSITSPPTTLTTLRENQPDEVRLWCYQQK